MEVSLILFLFTIVSLSSGLTNSQWIFVSSFITYRVLHESNKAMTMLIRKNDLLAHHQMYIVIYENNIE